jgi:hypothetical protein
LPTRSRISRAALLVKVIAAIFDGRQVLALDQMRDLLRDHPRLAAEPAPASTSSGPSQYSMAVRCC